MYGNENGWVYLALKTLTLEGKSDKKGAWTERYFRWPQQKKEIVEFVHEHKHGYDVYIGPAMYSKPSNNVEDVKGSNVFWVDFDGTIPTVERMQELGIPLPTWRNRSSIEGYEHWYWKSPEFVTDLATLQDTNKALTYALEGDLGGWFGSKVLRPVAGVNHKRNGEEVTILHHTQQMYSAKVFEDLEVHREVFTMVDFDPMLVPVATNILFSKKLDDPELIKLLQMPREDIRKDRSKLLSKMGHFLIEAGLDNMEVFSIIRWKDRDWGKFKDRDDATERYIRIVDYCRVKAKNKNPETMGNSFKLPFKGWRTFLQTTDDIKWVIDGILPLTGIALLAGPPGSGKTLLATELCKSLVLQKNLFGWRSCLDRPAKVMFLSLEMNGPKLKVFLDKGNPEDIYEQDLLEENFQIYSEVEPIEFFMPESEMINHLAKDIRYSRPDILYIDSATVSLAMELTSEKEVKESLRLLRKLAGVFEFSILMVAHTRKEVAGKTSSKASLTHKYLSDLFGTQALSAAADSVIMMVRDEDARGLEATISHVKTRYQENTERFTVKFDGNKHKFYRAAIPLTGAPPLIVEKDEDEPPTRKGFSIPI
jgi:archaellum biogenesis ATPase FlaH